jgi:hypothetical protein
MPMSIPLAVRRVAVVATLTTLALAAVALSSASSGGNRAACPAVGERVLARSSRAVAVDASLGPRYDGTSYIQICDRRSRRRARAGVDQMQALVDVRGTVVAAFSTDCLEADGTESCPEALGVANAATGSSVRLVRERRSPCPRSSDDYVCGDVHAILAGRTLSAVWGASDGAQRRILVMGPSGRARILATSSRIIFGSLRLSRNGRRVSWHVKGSHRRDSRQL